MIREGQVVLFRFPQTDHSAGKLRPALILRKLPGQYDDWMICMLSSQLTQQIPEFDEFIDSDDEDFEKSGLKMPSIVRLSRLAVVDENILLGTIGNISASRLDNIKKKLSSWIKGKQ